MFKQIFILLEIKLIDSFYLEKFIICCLKNNIHRLKIEQLFNIRPSSIDILK